jgi:hypothetical protein
MIHAEDGRSTRALVRSMAIVMALEITACATNLSAQIIAIGPPSFQSNDFPSMETLILDRLAMGGQYDPQDLSTLAHLTVLESIAALADVQSDMRSSVLGVRLEGELTQLWDAAAAFEESVSAGAIDARTLIRIQPLFNEMQGAYQEVESTLSASAGMSSRAAAHLRDITRLTAAASTMMNAIESNLLAGTPPPPRQPVDSDILTKQALLLANDVLGLIENVKSSKHPNSGWSAVKDDLQELLALIQTFQKTVSRHGPAHEIEASLHAVRRRLWRTEARIVKLGWPTDLERRWRTVRERLNAISDSLGLPRVIDLASRSRPDQTQPDSSTTKPATRIYRGPR